MGIRLWNTYVRNADGMRSKDRMYNIVQNGHADNG